MTIFVFSFHLGIGKCFSPFNVVGEFNEFVAKINFNVTAVWQRFVQDEVMNSFNDYTNIECAMRFRFLVSSK